MKSKKLIYQRKEFQEIDFGDRFLIILVSQKIKPCATFGVLKKVDHILQDLGLYYVMTKREKDFVYDITHKKKLFKELKMRVKFRLNDKRPRREWQKNHDHVGLGMFYGYPKCCAEAYARDLKKTGNPLPRALKQYFRYFAKHGTISQEIHFVNYYPCSMDCPESLELGRKTIEILGEFDPDAFIEFWGGYMPIQELESYIPNDEVIQKIGKGNSIA